MDHSLLKTVPIMYDQKYSRSPAVKKIILDLQKMQDPIYEELFDIEIVDDNPQLVKCTFKAINGTLYEKLTITLCLFFQMIILLNRPP